MKETMTFTHTSSHGEVKSFTFDYEFYYQAGFKFEQFLRFVTGDQDLIVSVDYEDDLMVKQTKRGKK